MQLADRHAAADPARRGLGFAQAAGDARRGARTGARTVKEDARTEHPRLTNTRSLTCILFEYACGFFSKSLQENL